VSQLHIDAFGDFCSIIMRNRLCGLLSKAPDLCPGVEIKDVPFLTSAAQDGLSPTLSAPCEQEKALFVSSLKALQCGYLILFQINMSGNFRWLCFVKGTLYPSTVLCLQSTMGSC
jgi:hypothetical protein